MQALCQIPTLHAAMATLASIFPSKPHALLPCDHYYSLYLWFRVDVPQKPNLIWSLFQARFVAMEIFFLWCLNVSSGCQNVGYITYKYHVVLRWEGWSSVCVLSFEDSESPEDRTTLTQRLCSSELNTSALCVHAHPERERGEARRVKEAEEC